jgi:tetratricopeptide (TPR) repeat protein
MAIAHAREAIRCLAASDQAARLAAAWEELAIAYAEKNSLADAADCFVTAAKHHRKLGSTTEAVRSGMLAGLCRFELESERDGIVACEAALAYGLRRAQTKEELGDLFWSYVAELKRRDKNGKAIASLRKIDKWAAKHAPVLRAPIGSSIGTLYLNMKEFGNALVEFERIGQQKLAFEDVRRRLGS